MVKKQIERCFILSFLSLSLVLIPVFSVQAQTLSELSDTDRKSVADALQVAQKQFEAKNFSEAIASLERAYGLFPEPNILYRIGVAYENLQEFKVANLYFRRYLALRPKAKDADNIRGHIKKNQERVDAELNTTKEALRFNIKVVSSPDGADIILDGVPQGKSPMSVSASVGRHLIEITKKGFIQKSVFVNLANKDAVVNANLTELVEPYSAPVWPWVAVGVGVVSIGVSSLAFSISETASAKVADYDKNKSAQRPADYDDTAQEAAIYEQVGYGTAIGGAIILTIGVYGLLLSPSNKQRSNFRLTSDGFALTF